jgi:DNA modification methylase
VSTRRKQVKKASVAPASGGSGAAERAAAAATNVPERPGGGPGTPPEAAPAPARLTVAEARRAIHEAQAIVPIIITRIELWKTEQLELLERNPRTHSDEQIAEIAASMREFGFLWPIIVNGETRQIVAGNGRYLAAVRLGLPLVPVIEEQHLTPVQRRAFIIADNKIALNAGWSSEILAGEFPALEAAGFDLGLTGFNDDEIEHILASVALDDGAPDEPPLPPVPADPVTRRGDLWLLGQHRVLCGDATSLADLQRALEGAPADAVWTDPPYNVAYEGSAGTIQNDALSEEEFADFLGRAFGALIGVMRPGASVYVAHADTSGFTFRRCFIEAGFKLASCLIWRKNALVLSRGDYHWQHEPILYGWKPGAAHRWFGARDKTTILEFNAEFNAPPFRQVGDNEWQIVLGETTLIVRGRDLTVQPVRGTVFLEDKPTSSSEHPTMKPVPLVRRMLANSARRGDRVFDPFGGSGSTLIACESLGLRGHLVELDERFVDVIVARWENLTGGKATRVPAPAGGEVPAVGQEVR